MGSDRANMEFCIANGVDAINGRSGCAERTTVRGRWTWWERVSSVGGSVRSAYEQVDAACSDE